MFTSHQQPVTAPLVAKHMSKVVFMGRNRGNKMCGLVGSCIKEQPTAFGSHQNQPMTLVCAKWKEFHFKVGNEDGSGLQYSVGSVWSFANHVQTQSRLGPLSLLDWREVGISNVGECPKNLHLKRLIRNEAKLERKQGGYKQNKDRLKPSGAEYE